MGELRSGREREGGRKRREMEGERRGEEDTKAEAGFKSSMPR